jgi:hypothetical protein
MKHTAHLMYTPHSRRRGIGRTPCYCWQFSLTVNRASNATVKECQQVTVEAADHLSAVTLSAPTFRDLYRDGKLNKCTSSNVRVYWLASLCVLTVYRGNNETGTRGIFK